MGETADRFVREADSNSENRRDLIGDVSGRFFTEVYQPIQNAPYYYEYWCKQEKRFRTITISTIVLCLFTLGFILLFRSYASIIIPNILTISCMIFLAYSIYKYTKLDSLANKLFR